MHLTERVNLAKFIRRIWPTLTVERRTEWQAHFTALGIEWPPPDPPTSTEE